VGVSDDDLEMGPVSPTGGSVPTEPRGRSREIRATAVPVTNTLVADGQALFREAIRTLIDEQDDMVVVHEASTLTRAVQLVATPPRPGVVLVDRMLCRDVVAGVARLRNAMRGGRVLLLDDVEDDAILLAAIEGGAAGYVTRRASLPDLLEAMRAVARGETVVPRPMLGRLLASLMGRRTQERAAFGKLARLTPRERQVLVHLGQGENNRAIARALFISPETARTHVQNLLRKLDVHSRLEAASFVREHLLGAYDVVIEPAEPTGP
jgi:DNA-binding NarL/FixJ family response regulator